MDLEQPIKDFPLLWKVYDHIVAHPEEWDQGVWAVQSKTLSCGTAFCFAGHAVMMSHPTAVPIWATGRDTDFSGADSVEIDGTMQTIPEAAKQALGLTSSERALLFNGSNDLETIHGLISEWEQTDLLNG